MVFFQSEYIHVEYHDNTKVLFSQWYGGCSSLQYRQAIIKSTRLSKELHAEYAVIDRRLLPPLSNEDFAWTHNFVLNTFKKLPYKRFAIVNAFNSKSALQQHQLYQYRTKDIPFEIRSFDDLTSAYDWLLSEDSIQADS